MTVLLDPLLLSAAASLGAARAFHGSLLYNESTKQELPVIGFLTRKLSKKMDDSRLTELQLEVSITDATTEDVDQVTRQLLSELREMNVESAQLVEAGPAPQGSKAVESIAIGSIAIATLPALLPKIVEAVQAWALRGTNRTVKFKGKVGRQAIEFEGSAEDLQRVLAQLSREKSKR